MENAYFTNATYYQKNESQEILVRNNESRFKHRKLKAKHDIKTIMDKPTLLPNSVAWDFVLPLAHLSGTRVDPYRTPSIFLPEVPARPINYSGPTSEQELKDLESLLLHMKLAP